MKYTNLSYNHDSIADKSLHAYNKAHLAIILIKNQFDECGQIKGLNNFPIPDKCLAKQTMIYLYNKLRQLGKPITIWH